MGAAITVERLSKQYRIGNANQDTMLRERLVSIAKFSFLRDRPREEVIWALQDVSFEISPGEVVGIIGRNGAGKSTLLKILSRITHPTYGRFNVKGRVASLLEVGTGFHEELTGRENIYLNGSILGMKKKEVDRKMDAIIEFSGIAKFLDTPIKRYSSGMRLRLGFAVAAHLDPEILIVDEVLAVGDVGFQKKCLAAIEGLQGGGRTVLFVSHNLAAVENLCKRCIWIDGGRVFQDGDSRKVIGGYMGSMADPDKSGADLASVENRRGSGKLRYTRIEFLSTDGTPKNVVRVGDPLVVRLHYRASEPVTGSSFGFRVYTSMGTLVTDVGTWHHGINVPVLQTGKGYLDLEISSLNLLPAKYTLSLWVTCNNGVVVHDNVEHAVTLEVEVSDVYGSGKIIDSRFGIVYLPQSWDLSGVGGSSALNGQSSPLVASRG